MSDIKAWEKVGIIGVDAGLCWVGDPCYVLHTDDKLESAKEIGATWQEFCDKLHGPDGRIASAVSLPYALGHQGLGVCVQTGWGDGVYNVYVRRTGNRIAELRVVFMDSELEPDADAE